MLGDLLTRWTIRLALACYVAYLAGWLTTRSAAWPRISRWIWTAGCGLFVLHVLCAFHFFHHWSPASAWQATADETQRLMGVAFGDGIYASYLFLAAWVLDVVWLWTFGSPPVATPSSATTVPRPGLPTGQTPWWRIGVHIFLLFIAFNGAIVFEAGPTRWFGIVACLALGVLAGRAGYNALRSGVVPEMKVRSQRNPKNRRAKEPKQMVH